MSCDSVVQDVRFAYERKPTRVDDNSKGCNRIPESQRKANFYGCVMLWNNTIVMPAPSLCRWLDGHAFFSTWSWEKEADAFMTCRQMRWSCLCVFWMVSSKVFQKHCASLINLSLWLIWGGGDTLTHTERKILKIISDYYGWLRISSLLYLI